MPNRCHFRIVQPWGPDRARQSTVVSEHASAADAFAEVDRIAETCAHNGTGGDYLELLVIDSAGRIVPRPDAH